MAKRTRSNGSWLGLFSFVSVMLLGLAITLTVLLGRFVDDISQITSLIEKIAIAIALVVPLVFSYREARRHGTAWFVLWIIAVILIIVFYILGTVWIF